MVKTMVNSVCRIKLVVGLYSEDHEVILVIEPRVKGMAWTRKPVCHPEMPRCSKKKICSIMAYTGLTTLVTYWSIYLSELCLKRKHESNRTDRGATKEEGALNNSDLGLNRTQPW